MIGIGIKSEDFTIKDRAGETARDYWQLGKQTHLHGLWGLLVFCGGLSVYILELITLSNVI